MLKTPLDAPFKQNHSAGSHDGHLNRKTKYLLIYFLVFLYNHSFLNVNDSMLYNCQQYLHTSLALLCVALGGVGVLGEGAKAALGGPGSRKGAGSSLQIKARNSAAQPLRVSERGDKTGTKCSLPGSRCEQEPGAGGGMLNPQPWELLPAWTETPKMTKIHPSPANEHQQKGKNPLYGEREELQGQIFPQHPIKGFVIPY